MVMSLIEAGYDVNLLFSSDFSTEPVETQQQGVGLRQDADRLRTQAEEGGRERRGSTADHERQPAPLWPSYRRSSAKPDALCCYTSRLPDPDCRASLAGLLITGCLQRGWRQAHSQSPEYPLGAKRGRQPNSVYTLSFPPPAQGCRLCAACCASAAAFFEEVFAIFASVVVGYFVSRGDGTQRYDHDPTLAHHRLRIRAARMIDVTCHIPSWRSVDCPSVVKFEHIFGASSLASVGFLGRDAPTAIRRDVRGPLDQLRREQAKARRRAGDAKGA